MEFFSVKTKDPNTVQKILNKENNIEFDRINVLENELREGAIVFVVLGGDNPPWETGLIGIGVISKEPYDKVDRNFKIQVNVKVLMDRPIKRADLIPFRETYGIIGIAPVVKWEPNQALSRIEEGKAIALLRAFIELSPATMSDMHDLFGIDVMNRIKDITIKSVEVPFKYGETETNAITRYIENLEEGQSIDNTLTDIPYAWYVGAQINNVDLTDTFINEGRWENGWGVNKNTDVVKSIKVGDHIAIKAIYTRKNGLPFNNNGKIVSVMGIKAIGVVEENIGDGIHLKVKWEKITPVKEWYAFCIIFGTVELVEAKKQFEKNLLQFTFQNATQDYEYCEEKYKIEQDNDSVVVTGGYNKMFYGVPGSGKSHQIAMICSDEDLMERVVFHPDYTYSDFVGQILPRVENKTVDYEFSAGPFTRILFKALSNPGKMYYLVIEEINRGNAPAIFGDIFQLLDRNDDGESVYGITNKDITDYICEEMVSEEDKEKYRDKKIKVPSNLTILATMNTSDQNVFTLDTAFQRRWEMKHISNDFESDKHKEHVATVIEEKITWFAFATKVNEAIVATTASYGISEDKQLGVYFARKQDFAKENFAEKVLKYLWDDAVKIERTTIFDMEKANTFEAVVKAYNKEGLKGVLKDELYNVIKDCPLPKYSSDSQLTDLFQVEL